MTGASSLKIVFIIIIIITKSKVNDDSVTWLVFEVAEYYIDDKAKEIWQNRWQVQMETPHIFMVDCDVRYIAC